MVFIIHLLSFLSPEHQLQVYFQQELHQLQALLQLLLLLIISPLVQRVFLIQVAIALYSPQPLLLAVIIIVLVNAFPFAVIDHLVQLPIVLLHSDHIRDLDHFSYCCHCNHQIYFLEISFRIMLHLVI